jgi:hypothetical protein
MRGDYGSMVWVNDEEGHEFVCTVERDFDKKHDLKDLTEAERKSCVDVSQIVGTERW